MVFVELKQLILGKPKSAPLLPVSTDANTNYSSLDNSSVKSSLSYEGVSNPRIVSDIILGLSDGLTVPFALTAGLSSLGDTKIVLTGGLAELVSGAISMGLGGFLAAKSEVEYYHNQIAKEKDAYNLDRNTVDEIAEALGEYKLSKTTIAAIAHDIEQSSEIYSSFIVKAVRGIDEPSEGREFTSAMTIGAAYFFGGFVPLIPYFFADVVQTGLVYSVGIMVFALLIFGYVKTLLSLGTETPRKTCFFNALSMLFTGGFAAGSAWFMVRILG